MAYKPPAPIVRMQTHLQHTIEKLEDQIRIAQAQIDILRTMRAFGDTVMRDTKVKF